MSPLLPEKLAERLHQARLTRSEIAPLTAEVADLSPTTAYDIQARGIALRLKDGERVVGYKMGLTSEAKRRQMNLHSPVYGVLTDAMRLESGASWSMAGSIHPKIEPEIAFVIGKPLKHPNTAHDVLQACTSICAALEILDSRYRDFKYFSLPDVIADNSSSHMFVLGPVIQDLANQIANPAMLENLSMKMSVNGELVEQASSGAISGNPLTSVVQLAELLHARGESIAAGTIVLAGAATPAVMLKPGMQIDLAVDRLPGTSLHIA